MSQYMSCFSVTYIVIYPENLKYLKKYLKYFPMYLFLNTFVFKSICIWVTQEYLYLNTFQCIWPHVWSQYPRYIYLYAKLEKQNLNSFWDMAANGAWQMQSGA